MNNKNGFTLVELMAVLVMLGVLLLMAMPSITKTFKDSQELELEEYQDTICFGAKSYMSLEKDTNGKKYAYPQTLKIEELKTLGYIRVSIKVPESAENLGCVRIESNQKCNLVACG